MTQNDSILQALKFGRKLTPMAALRLYGCFRLSARVWDLRRRGYKIKVETIYVRGKRFAAYSMGG